MTDISYSGLITKSSNKQSLSKCPFISIVVPKDKRTPMRKILKPFGKYVPIIDHALEVIEKDSAPQDILSSQQSETPPPYAISQEQLSSPAIAIILMVPEGSSHGASTAKSIFHKVPWRLHHRIQAQDKNSLNVIGSQEFHFISRTYPLWSVITTPVTSRRLRLNIFVRRYNAMVEFYRLVTNSEMESQKPGFCVFPLNPETYRNGNLLPSPQRDDDRTTCELALKQCAHLNPYVLHNVRLIFPVYNFESLKTLLQSKIRSLSPRHCLVNDPDGNAIVLYDTSSVSSTDSIPSASTRLPVHSQWTPDQISAHSESIDSGHFSDFELV